MEPLYVPIALAILISNTCRPQGCIKIVDTKMVIRNVEQAVVHYQTDNVEQCPPSIAALVEGRYLAKLPLDRWGHPLSFRCPGLYNPDGVDIRSAGRDGELYTDDDIVSWRL
jgi:hypothetical protein